MTGPPPLTGRVIAACWKWVDHRVEVDPLTAAVHTDTRTSGPSDADVAALAWALAIGKAWARPVRLVAAGPTAVEPMLRDGLALGASAAQRVDMDLDAPSGVVATGLAAVLADADVVVCGAWSLDRGSGSVPAYLAGGLGAAQALGLVGLEVPAGAGPLPAERRLDGGRRERLSVPLPAVVSVEAGTRHPDRAPLAAVVDAAHRPIPVHPGPPAAALRPVPITAVYRPRARVLEGPTGGSARDRILALTGAEASRPGTRIVHLDPEAAADVLLDQLRAWGYLP